MQGKRRTAERGAASPYLGYHFSPAGMKIAAKTIANFIEKASRLYEQRWNAV
jgi:hypothetical protein